jgi:glycosyltransferase involved in cell wall biosynthesis
VRVLLVTSIDRGGPLEQARVLAAALVRAGHDVGAVCATDAIAERFRQVGVDVKAIPLRHVLDAGQAARIARLARGADVVHAHDRRSSLWVRLSPRPRRGGLRVCTAHGIPEPYHPPPAGPPRPSFRSRLAYGVLDARLYARADAVIVPSRAIADDLMTRLGYPRRKIVVIPNGIELDRVAAQGSGELVGTLSVLEPFKGIDVFLRAAARLAPQRPSLRFAIFGGGGQAEALERLAQELGLADRVARPGFVPATEAFPQLGVYVLSSYWENAPMALLEAMAAKVPVVATEVYGIPEIVDETTGRMVPPGDPARLAEAIAAALDDVPGTAARVRAARRRVEERFSAEANMSAVVRVYERLLS